MSRSSAAVDRIHRWLGRWRLPTRAALLLRNQSRAIIKYHLMTSHDVRASGEEWLLQRIGQRCRIIVDVGANRGDWYQVALRHMPNLDRAILFEPGLRAAELLRERFASSDRVEIVQTALSDQQEAEAHFFEEPNAGETSSLMRGAATAAAVATTVRVTTIDAEARRLGIAKIDFLKIDTEGSDLAVLRGAAALLRAGRVAVVQWEYGDAWAAGGGTLAAALEFMTAAGYRSYLLKSDGLYRFDYRIWGDFFTYANFVSVTEDDTSLGIDAKDLL